MCVITAQQRLTSRHDSGILLIFAARQRHSGTLRQVSVYPHFKDTNNYRAPPSAGACVLSPCKSSPFPAFITLRSPTIITQACQHTLPLRRVAHFAVAQLHWCVLSTPIHIWYSETSKSLYYARLTIQCEGVCRGEGGKAMNENSWLYRHQKTLRRIPIMTVVYTYNPYMKGRAIIGH